MKSTPDLGIPPNPATPTEIQASVGQMISELFDVQALLRLSHFSLETIAARDPDRIGVDADDRARVSALALEKLEAITLRLDGVWPVIGRLGGGGHG
ncbi:hypothetical protein SAMN02949497_4398 [Methylomagnum ishizawai]|uniref:Uncharacterized protein n=1 Tax=Methylomagnum ishizawai TaxID=1760988 RepID=A0A1Y6D9V8_9GAMM|nr:hypothetical protein [Methylomagnum ishizawai]SMF96984.1 hypothetical protein SAMN02949497_4398 [Methylomagnum ishizawai]